MHPIENLLQTTMKELKEMVDVNTIVGDAFVSPNGSTIIPVSKVSFGFVTGGAEYNDKLKTEVSARPFAGGCASGITISPVAFLISDGSNVKLMSSNPKCAIEKIIDNAPQIISEMRSVFGCCCVQAEQPEGEADDD